MATLRQKIRVEVDARELNELRRDMRRTSQEGRGLASTVSGKLKAAFAAVGFGLIAQKIKDVGIQLFQVSSNVEETADAFQRVFGNAAGVVDSFLADFGRLAGMTKTEGREIATNLGAVAQGFGATRREAAEFSNQVIELAGDIGSLRNVDPSQVLQAIQSGLIGEQEPLRRYGVLLNAAKVEQKALEMTGKELGKQLTDQEKVYARLALITEQTELAHGNLRDTQDSNANSARILRRDMRQLRENFSTGLIPTYRELLDEARNLLDNFRATQGAVGGALAGAVNRFVLILVDLGISMGRAADATLLLLQTLGLVGEGKGFFEIIADQFADWADNIQIVADVTEGLVLNLERLNVARLRLLKSGSGLIGADDAVAFREQQIAAAEARIGAIKAEQEAERQADAERRKRREQLQKDLERLRDEMNQTGEAAGPAFAEFARWLGGDGGSGGGGGGGGGGAPTSIPEAVRIAQEEIRDFRRAVDEAFDLEGISLDLPDALATPGTFDDSIGSARDIIAEFRRELELTTDPARRKEIRAQVKQWEALLKVMEGGDGLVDNTKQFGEQLQDIGRAIRSVTQLAGALGELDDVTRAWAEGLASSLDNLGRFIELQDEGASALSLAAPTIGVLAGVGSIVASLVQASKAERQEMQRLTRALGEASRRIEDSIEETFSGGQIGGGISESVLSRIRLIFALLTDRQGIAANQDNIASMLSFLEGTGLAPFQGITEVFETLFQSLQNQFTTELATGEMSLLDILEMALQRLFTSDEFGNLDEFIGDLGDQLGTFSDDVAGVIEELRLLMQFAGVEGVAALQQFIASLLELEEVPAGLRDALTEIQGLDLSTEAGRARLNEIIAAIAAALASGELELGGLTPDEVEDILDTLQGLAEGEGIPGTVGDEGFTRRTQIGRSLTEIQANEFIAIAESQLFVLQQIRELLGGAAPDYGYLARPPDGRRPVGRGAAGGARMPLTINVHGAEISADGILRRIEPELRRLERSGRFRLR